MKRRRRTLRVWDLNGIAVHDDDGCFMDPLPIQDHTICREILRGVEWINASGEGVSRYEHNLTWHETMMPPEPDGTLEREFL
jgi:hypothetical protein